MGEQHYNPEVAGAPCAAAEGLGAISTTDELRQLERLVRAKPGKRRLVSPCCRATVTLKGVYWCAACGSRFESLRALVVEEGQRR